jgi:hypothetical protein
MATTIPSRRPKGLKPILIHNRGPLGLFDRVTVNRQSGTFSTGTGRIGAYAEVV